MKTDFNFEKVSVSWTKYDIVHVLDLVDSEEVLLSYVKGDARINESILKSFLGIKKKSDPIPEFWFEIFSFSAEERRFFSFFLLLFTSGRIANLFATRYITGPFKGVFVVDEGSKECTNIRSLLVEGGLSLSSYRRTKEVPFDGSILLNSPSIGKLFKKALLNTISINSSYFHENDFYTICEYNSFNKILGLDFNRFINWLEGVPLEPSYIQSVSFKKFLCFKEPISLNFEESKEIYFLGENGDGKSLLLIALFLAFKADYIQNEIDAKYVGEAISWINKVSDSQLEGCDNEGQKYNLNNAPPFPHMYAYGTHRGRFSGLTDPSIEKYGFMSLFSIEKTLRDPLAWLLQLKVKEQEDALNYPDISFENLSKVISELLERKVEVAFNNGFVWFKEKGYKLGLEDLSEGYRSIIIFICDLLSRLSEDSKEGENVFLQKGVVFIDEIDQHLHPRWQRTIVKKIRSLFPGIQFFMTTHSATIIQGASEDAIIYRVYREDGVAIVSDPYYRNRMNHMMLNTLITSSLFGLDDAAMDGAIDVDTNDSYLMSHIESQINIKLNERRNKGINFFSDEELDKMIKEILEKELTYEENK